MSKHLGKCALCGKECELSFEHIPPRAAFNWFPAKPVTGDKVFEGINRFPWDTTGLKYTNQQQGMGKYSLCTECNNNTGSWYGNSYTEIAKIMHYIISKPISPDIVGIEIKEIYPLRFIKQILSMFCSINNFEDERIDTLRQFVINRDFVGLEKSKYKICMYHTKSRLVKYAPLSVVLRKTQDGFVSIALTEITAYPLGFILYFDPTDTFYYDGLDITDFSNYTYDYKADIQMPFCIKEMNDILPTFYRSKEEIKMCIEKNKSKVNPNEN